MQLCDIANKAGRYSKTKQASRGLSAIAELLVLHLTDKYGANGSSTTMTKMLFSFILKVLYVLTQISSDIIS